ncbi:MAG: hypothetical protein AAGU11_14060 [Syntrophobacteraceae bacterium]
MAGLPLGWVNHGKSEKCRQYPGHQFVAWFRGRAVKGGAVLTVYWWAQKRAHPAKPHAWNLRLWTLEKRTISGDDSVASVKT